LFLHLTPENLNHEPRTRGRTDDSDFAKLRTAAANEPEAPVNTAKFTAAAMRDIGPLAISFISVVTI
jgi:hypothetical protein